MLENENLNTGFIEIQGRSRINVTVSNKASHSQTRLSFPGPTVNAADKKKLSDLFQRQKNTSFLLLGGSLPQGFSHKDILQLMKIAHKNNIKPVIDCPGSVLAQIIDAKPFLIKPNLDEFQELTNSGVKTIGAVIQKAKLFLDRVNYICVSSVENGTLLISRENIYFGRIPSVHVRSTVGAGDSMVGAMVSRFYLNDQDQANILKWGLAASAATLCEHGMTLGHKPEIIKLYAKTRVKKIQ